MLEAHDIQVRTRSKVIIEDVSIAAAPGELLAVVGPNGAGKSTALRALAGATTPSRGEVWLGRRLLEDWPLAERARRRALLPQRPALTASLRVFDVALLGRHGTRRQTARDRDLAASCLDELGVAHLSARAYSSLSGGEQQRVQLARVLAQLSDEEHERYLLLDEPTAPLDLAQQLEVLEALRRFAARGAGVVFSVHDLNLAARFADRVVMLDRGRLARAGPTRAVLTAPAIREVFGVEVDVLATSGANVPLIVARAATGKTQERRST